MEFIKQTIFGSVLMPIMVVLGITSGLTYIETQVDEVTIDYKSEQGTPIYYNIPVKNIGEKARFDISTEDSWIFVYREGNNTLKSVTISQGNTVNFTLEFRPEFLDSGQHIAKVKISASNPSDSTLWENKEIKVIFNKNYTAWANESVSPAITPEVSVSPSATPQSSASSAPSVTSQVLLSPNPSAAVATVKPISSPKTFAPQASITQAPQVSLTPFALPDEVGDENSDVPFVIRLWRYLMSIF